MIGLLERKRLKNHNEMYNMTAQTAGYLEQTKKDVETIRNDYYQKARASRISGNDIATKENLAYVRHYDGKLVEIDKKIDVARLANVEARTNVIDSQLAQNGNMDRINAYLGKIKTDIDKEGALGKNKTNEAIGRANDVRRARDANSKTNTIQPSYLPSVDELLVSLDAEIATESHRVRNNLNELEQAVESAQN